MKKLIFLLAIACTFSNAMAQTAWTTMYKVAPENMQAAKDAIGKKTKKFNSKADGELIYTFQYDLIQKSAPDRTLYISQIYLNVLYLNIL